MRPDSGIDQTSLAWLKPEIDASLGRAGEALERYADDNFSGDGVEVASAALHEVLGGLRMLELYGAALVAEEMERLVSEIAGGRVQRVEDALTSLLRAILQLPDYLERLQGGYRDVPIVLLPLLNDLRSCRGEKLLSESVLLIPPSDPELPAHVGRPDSRLGSTDLERALNGLRRDWQFGLLQWFRGQSNEAALERLAGVCDRVLAVVSVRSARQLWWVAAAITDALRNNGLDASISTKLLYGRLDRELKRLIDQGETLYAQSPAGDLQRSLLYYVAQSGGSERIAEVQSAFGLTDLVPSSEEVDQARGALTGRNSSLLNSVVHALEEELLRVKDALDLFLRGNRADGSSMQPELETLDRVADTLGMLGMGIERSEVKAQRDALAGIAAGGDAGEQTLLDIAAALLKVESSLQEHRERLGVQPGSEAGRDQRLSDGERRRLTQAVLREAAVNLQQSKELFLAHLSSPAGNTHSQAAAVMLRDVAGALRLLEFEAAAERALALAGFLRSRDTLDQPLSAAQIDGFADGLTGLEYYLELVADHQGHDDDRLAPVTDALVRLGHWPPQVSLHELFGAGEGEQRAAPAAAPAAGSDPGAGESQARAGAADDDATGTDAGRESGAESADGRPESDEPGPAPVAADNDGSASASVQRFRELVAAAGFGFDDDSVAGTDEDIRATFLDELSEEIASLEDLVPAWCTTPDNLELLRSIRRSFHTVKGSGRMVGARLLGEFAWQAENLLNKVLNNQRLASPGVIRVVEHVASTLPEFHAALCGDVLPRRDVAAVMAAAADLADGQEVLLPRNITAGVAADAQAGSPPAPPAEAGPAIEAVEPPRAAAPAAGSDHGDGGTRLDPVLLDILRSEVAGHLGVIDAYLHDARENSALAMVPEHLLRAVHTLNGAFGAVELAEVTVLTSALESYVRRLRGLHRAPITDGYDAISAASGWLGAVVEALEQGRPLPPLHGLPGRLQALTGDLPELRDDTAWLVGEPVPSVQELMASGAAASGPAGLDQVPELAPVVAAGADGADGADAPHDDSEAPHDDGTAIDADAAAFADAAEVEATAAGERDPDAVGDGQAAAAASDDRSAADPVDPVGDRGDDAAASVDARAQAEDEDDAGADAGTDRGAAADETPDVMPEVGAVAAADAGSEEDGADDAAEAAGPTDFNEAGADLPAAADVEAAASGDATAAGIAVPASGTEAVPAQDAGGATAAPAAEADEGPGQQDRQLLRQLLDALPPVAPTEVDPDLAELFREEAREILDRCEQHLARRDKVGAAALSQELARELHTLKGGARMAGFTDAGELGHAMESLLEAAANDQRDLVDADLGLIGRCLDRLNHQIFPGLAPVAPVAPVAPPVATAAPAAVPPPPASVAAAQADAPVRAPTSPMPGRGRRPDAFVIRPKADVQPEPIDTGVAEFVRVRADQLDSLVNLAGEVGIIRTRLEQQVGSFRFSLEEFEQTVQRLREQLRKLEIEAETQILSREVRVQEQSGNTGFDPLEMDRFSQLQQLSRALAESMSDLQSIQGLLDEHTRLAESLLLQQSRAGAELQEGLMRARMVPFESMLPRLRRLVRQEAEALGKRVRLNVEGAQGELDRGVLERMAAPFEHMLRNALVHGLETPAERRKAAKGEEGEVRIKVAREATEVVIEVADDGRGIDPQRVRRTAIERGLLSAESDLSDRDLYGFILEPGFSTASELTQYAGRGVGLDVVASEIKQLGGSLTIDSSAGQGASFRIRLPYTLAVSQAVLVRVADHTFAIPMVGVQGIVRLSYANYKERLKEARPKVDYAGDDYEIYELDNVLGLPAGLLDDSAQVPLLMVRSGDLRVAMRVDSLLGGREIVVKPVGPQLARIPGVFGATILGDGAVVVILDVAALLRRAAALRDRGDVQTQVPLAPAVRQRPLVLVVDDSITMRKVSARVLEREGYEVQTAKDGLDALEHVHERLPDVILLDLEMPRMDGYEFAGYMRNDPRFRDVPIVVITSRVGEKHRARAFELGVNRYLGKPYQEADMLSAVTELLAERRAANER